MQWLGRRNDSTKNKMTTKTSQYDVGDRVTVIPGKEHDGMGKGEVGYWRKVEGKL